MMNTSVRAEPPEDWLATLIRRILHTWIDGAEPPPDVWTRVRRRTKATIASTFLSTFYLEEAHHVSE
jgi:hypothetical protein